MVSQVPRGLDPLNCQRNHAIFLMKCRQIQSHAANILTLSGRRWYAHIYTPLKVDSVQRRMKDGRYDEPTSACRVKLARADDQRLGGRAMTLTRPVTLAPDLAGLLPAHARTFAFATRFLPAADRPAVVTLYAFCRLVDDLVDERPASVSADAVRRDLDTWRRWLAGRGHSAPPSPANLAFALRDLVEERRLPVPFLLALIDGVESDLDPVAVPSFAVLRNYCWQVAGTVGRLMCHLLSPDHPVEASAAATDLGIAMQLTNVLRDVGKDLRQARVYLPADEMARFGSSVGRLHVLAASGQPPDDDLRELIQFQIERARRYYARGLAGVWLLPPSARLSILLAGRLYRAILDDIEASGYDVLRRRASTSKIVKAREALAALAIVRLWGDPSSAGEAMAIPNEMSEVSTWRRSS
jgi:15-cis-phytoene synthase